MTTSKSFKLKISGIIAGLLIWAYDYDFFLNAGGPKTPISNAILQAVHLTNLPYPWFVLLPAVTLAVASMLLAIMLGKIIR